MRALAGSLGLHLLVLGALSGIVNVESGGVAPAEPLRAVLRGESRPEPAAMSAAPARRVVAPLPEKRIAAAVPPAPTFAVPESQAITAAPSSPGGEPRPREPTEAASVALASLQSAAGPDAAGLRQYRLALAGEARRFRQYPDAARRAGLHGTAEVRVSIGLGVLRQTELARSSGHALLDNAALEMLRAAAARTILPESLRGQEFAVLLPVVFEVED